MAGELAHVVSDHVPVNDGTFGWPKFCAACGVAWPCHTFQRQLQGQSGNRADRMRAHMTVWSLRLLSRPELAFVGPEVSAQLLGWIDNAVAAQEAVDRARKAVQLKAQSAASRFAGRAWTAAGRFVPVPGARHAMQVPPHDRSGWGDLDGVAVPAPDGSDQPAGGALRRQVSRWRFGRSHRGN